MASRGGRVLAFSAVAQSRLPLSWILGATALALAAAGLVVVVGSGAGGDDEGAGDTTGNSITLSDPGALPPSVHDVVLEDIGGDEQRPLHSYMDGRPVVVNFFASWCTPCVEEMPAFERVHEDLGDAVQIVGLAMQDGDERAQGIVDRTGVTYPTFADPEGSALTFFEGTNMPTTVFIAPDGDVAEVHGGELSEDDLRGRIAEHFGIEGSGDAPASGSGSGQAGGG
jgi:cytochrome c biogenesis protein CcmG, thiol:disulfide interchange protein DsbE